MPDFAPVTVVMPAYNGEAFIGEALRSVADQTLPVAEVIVVDDGSSDRGPSIAESSGARVIRQSNRGVAEARNTGVRAASQPWIAFLDQDDVWEPGKVERQWHAAQLCPDAGLVGCDFSQFRGEQVVVPSILFRPEFRYDGAERIRVGPGISHFSRFDMKFYMAGNFLFPSAVMARRDLLLSVGLFDGNFNGIDECDCFHRIMARSSLVVVEEVLMRYRLHEQNASKDSLKIIMGYIGISQKMLEHPELYPPAAVEATQTELPAIYAAAGRILINQGRLHEARELLGQSLRRRAALHPSVLWLSTWLTPAMIDQLLKAKRLLLNRGAS